VDHEAAPGRCPSSPRLTITALKLRPDLKEVMQNRRITIIGHLPLNHQLRGLYRAIIAVGGLVLALFGILWIVADGSLIGGDGASVLGLHANGRFGLVSVVLGAALVIAAVVGRNADHWVGFLLAALLMVLGILNLALIRTTPEPFALSAGTCIALLGLGAVLMCAASYVGTGSAAEARHRTLAIGHLTAAEYAAAHDGESPNTQQKASASAGR
jgi:hypothetical protein